MTSTSTTQRASDGHKAVPHLKLVRYQPPGVRPRICAAVWEERGRVHLVTPLLRSTHGLLDPQPFARQFGTGCRLDLFEQAMTSLDAACYSATRTAEVREVCSSHPEWGLSCDRFEGTDDSLAALHDLIRAAESSSPLPRPLLFQCLLDAVEGILCVDERLVTAQIERLTDEGDDAAVVELKGGTRILLTVRQPVDTSTAVSLGVAAHYRAARRSFGADKCLLILPELAIGEPMKLTRLAAIANLDPAVIRGALSFLAGPDV